MLKFLADENFNNHIVRALLRRNKNFDIIRVQDVGLSGVDDETILEFTTLENRLLLTHDAKTITKYAYEKMVKGEKVCGVIEISRAVPIRSAIEDILLLAGGSLENEWDNQIIYLPLR